MYVAYRSRLFLEVTMNAINPVLIIRILLVVLAGVFTYRRTKSVQATVVAVVLTAALVWGLSYVADQFME